MEYSKGDITAGDEIRYAVNNERNAKAAENPIITMKGIQIPQINVLYLLMGQVQNNIVHTFSVSTLSILVQTGTNILQHAMIKLKHSFQIDLVFGK